MNGILGMASVLLEGPLNEEQRDQAEIISTSGQALLTIINDILDFSKIEAGKLDLEKIGFLVVLLQQQMLEFVFEQLDSGKVQHLHQQQK